MKRHVKQNLKIRRLFKQGIRGKTLGKKFKCDDCNKYVQDKSTLNHHNKIHQHPSKNRWNMCTQKLSL
jgi:hypothetical protein